MSLHIRLSLYLLIIVGGLCLQPQAYAKTALEVKIDQMNTTISNLDKEILTFQKQHQKLQNDIKILNAQIDQQSDKIKLDIQKFNKHILTTTHLAHQQKGLPNIKNPQQEAVLQHMQKWLSLQVENSQNKLTTLHQTQAKLNKKGLEFQDVAETLKTRKLKLNTARAQLLKTLNIQDKTLANRLKQSQQKTPTLSQKTPTKIISGQKITRPTNGLLITKYNHKDTQGIKAKGITIQATPQAAVKAVRSGTLLYAGDFRTYGGLIIIKTKDNQQHIYGGIENYQYKVGDTIKENDTIAFLPNTDAPSLYFETRKNNTEFDPLALLH